MLRDEKLLNLYSGPNIIKEINLIKINQMKLN